MKNIKKKKKKKKKRSPARLAIAITLLPGLAFVALLCFLHFYEPALSWLVGKGVPVERLGQLGDSFGSLTVTYAAIAALGAWLGYDAQRKQLQYQRKQLNDEKARWRGARFDEAFFRLLDFYDVEIAKLHRNLVYAGGDKPTDLHGQGSSGREYIRHLRQGIEAQRAAHPTADGPFSLQWSLQQVYRKEHFLDVEKFGQQLVAITKWLHEVSFGVAVSRRGALLEPRLSDDELWLWGLSIAYTRDDSLMQFAQRLGIVGEGGSPPKGISTGRVFSAFALEQEMEAFDVQVNRHLPGG